MTKVAIVQRAPEFLNKKDTITLAASLVKEAAIGGAKLVIFTETFIPGYPAWIWRLRPGGDWSVSEVLYKRLFTNTVKIESSDLEPLYKSAKKHKVTIVCGMNECDSNLSRATLYNTVIVIGPDGTLLNRHRKLMPTNPERMIWGMGDASGLKVVDTPAGRLGTLICWENYMPLARYAMYSQGLEIYIAPTYDSGDKWVGTLQHIAREGRCWVIGCGNLLKGSDIPDDIPGKSKLYPDDSEWVNPGDSVVIDPTGEISLGPVSKEEGIFYCDIDLELVHTAKRTLDVTGHYSRPDIFKLHVNTNPQIPVEFE